MSVIQVTLPPLRERPEDVPLLLEHFARLLSMPCQFSPESLELLKGHPWPGNVRALRNLVERVGVLCQGRIIRPEDLRLTDRPSNDSPPQTLESVERDVILKTFRKLGGNKTQTAKTLGIAVSTLKEKLRRFGIESD